MAGKIQVKIVGDASGLSKAFNQASRDARSFGSRVSSTLGGIAKAGAFAGIAAGVVGVTTVLRAGFSEWQEQAKVASATGAILKSTGGIANVTAKHVEELAQSIMAKTGVDDEAVQASENLLLTFKNVRNELGRGNDVFNRATRAAVDLSQAGFGSMESASKMLGKALNDPTAGLTALGRAGVTFSAAQKEAIKDLVKSGETLKAQKVILGEVESQVGGVAEAYGKTMPGQIAIAKEQFNNLSGTLVGSLAPAFSAVLGATNDFLRKFSEADGATAKFKVVTSTLGDLARATADGISHTLRSIDWREVGNALVSAWKLEFQLFVSAVRAVDWRGLARLIGDNVLRAIEQLDDVIRSADWVAIGRTMIDGLGKAVVAVGHWLAGVDWGRVFGAAFKLIYAVLRAEAEILLGIGQQVGLKLLQGIQKGAAAGWGLLKSWLSQLPALVIGLFASAGSWLVNAGKEAILGFLRGAESVFQTVLGRIRSMVAQLNAAAASVPGAGVLGSAGGKIGGGRAGNVPLPKRSTQAIEKETDSIVAVLKRRSQEVLREVNYLQQQLDKVNARREREDLASAVRNAQTNLAQVRSDKKATQTQIEDAERQLARAQEDIRLAARNRELTAAQAHYDRVKAQLEKANQAMLDKQQKAAEAFQKVLDKARDRAANSFQRLSSLIQRGFDAVTDAWVAPSQQAIDAITNRRANEDLAEAVSDAQARLAEAMEGDDQEAILDAQRALARAKEDITVASLQRQAEAETTANDKKVASQRDALDRMLANLQASFTNTGVETDKGMAAVLKIINGYLGGFKNAGQTLGDAFGASLREAMRKALEDSNALAGTKSRTISPMPDYSNVIRIPGLASGGSVLRTGIALVHRGETVMPAKASGGGITFERGAIVVNGFVGSDQDIAARVVDTINSNQRVGRLKFNFQ